jgi:hypothetical protein
MAKRKGMKRKGSMTRKRKSYKVGSAAPYKTAGAALVGAVASRFIVNSIGKVVTQVNTPTAKAIAQIALGVLTKPIAGLIGSKSPMVDALASGMMIGGGYELLKVSVPAAFGAAEGDDVIVVSGTEISEINGMDDIGAMDISEINGMDDIGYYNVEDYND